MGTNARPFSLRTVIKAKMIMRVGDMKEQLVALRPIYSETIDTLFLRAKTPLRAPTRHTHPEWYSRATSNDNLWTARCHGIIKTMIYSMTQLSRWGVGNVRVMADLSGPPPSPDIAGRLYLAIMAQVGSHNAALRAFRRTPVHHRTEGMPDHLLMRQVRSCIERGDFSQLPAQPGSGWDILCVTASERQRATYNNSMETLMNIDGTLVQLQSDLTEVPRQACHDVDEGLWTGNNKRTDQIVDAIHNMKRLPFMDRDKQLSPQARFGQVHQAELDNRLLWETVPEHNRWYLVCMKHAVWALNSRQNVSRPIDLNIDYHALPDSSLESTIVDDAIWIIMNLPGGCDSLQETILRVGPHASGKKSAQEIMREVRRRVTTPTTSGAEYPAPTTEWEIYTTRIEDLLKEACVSDAFEVTMQHRPHMEAWDRGDFMPGVAHGGPPGADHRLVMTEEKKAFSTTLQLLRAWEAPATHQRERPDTHSHAAVWARAVGTIITRDEERSSDEPARHDTGKGAAPRPNRNALGQNMNPGSIWHRVHASVAERSAPSPTITRNGRTSNTPAGLDIRGTTDCPPPHDTRTHNGQGRTRALQQSRSRSRLPQGPSRAHGPHHVKALPATEDTTGNHGPGGKVAR